MKEPCIKVDQLRVIYNKGKSNEVRSLDGVDVEIYPEEYIIIYGPSGCGKSTLLNILGILDDYDEGLYTLDGKQIRGLNETNAARTRNEMIGFVFQSFNLISF
ncbi:MAG TPA: ATP-binding cassette domain-containing protein, partial [Candidatus Moranbacteria bacterium]|nr:ATP-binding cassette domain-containing protein [Candidatus Moranbacteria bacterium]